MKRSYPVRILLLLLLAGSISGCSIFKGKKCDCPRWGSHTSQPAAKRPAWQRSSQLFYCKSTPWNKGRML